MGKYNDYTNPSIERLSKTEALLDAVNKGYLKNFDKDSLSSVYQLQKDSTFIQKIAFIKQKPGSYASLFAFSQWILISPRFSPDSLNNIFALLDEELRETTLGKSVKESIKRKELLQLDSEIPDFIFTTQGKLSRLTAFRGQKHVLLCFWASWCGPCVRNIPLLKKIDSIYSKKGLQIISISIDKNKEEWLSALKKYNMPWLQTLDTRNDTEKGNIQTLYEIYYIPQYFLVDKNGKLIYQGFLTDDTDDHDLLKDVLQKALGS